MIETAKYVGYCMKEEPKICIFPEHDKFRVLLGHHAYETSLERVKGLLELDAEYRVHRAITDLAPTPEGELSELSRQLQRNLLLEQKLTKLELESKSKIEQLKAMVARRDNMVRELEREQRRHEDCRKANHRTTLKRRANWREKCFEFAHELADLRRNGTEPFAAACADELNEDGCKRLMKALGI